MKIGKLGLLLLCTFIYAIQINAASLTPKDFAYGITVETKGKASLWQVSLPEDIYEKVTRSDLGDIRVFDASGQTVPHMLQSPEGTIKEPPKPITLPFFPLYRSDEKKDTGHSLRIITDDNGAVVNVIRESAPTSKKKIILAYLLDASKIEHKPIKLILDWESKKETGFSVNVNIDVSDDLSDWDRLIHNTTLADLQFGKDQLSYREIKIPVRAYKYLRISWPETLHDVKLKSVTAEFPSTEQPPQRHWLKVKGIKSPELPISYDFDTKGNWPVDQARFIFPPQNMLINVELASRSDDTYDWTRRHLGPFYSLLKDDGTVLYSPPANFGVTMDRYWHIEEVGGGNVLERYTPVLELGWIPHVLTFMAQGKPPYVIAFGSGTVEPLQRTVDLMTFAGYGPQQKVLIKTATTSQSYMLGGVEKLEQPSPPLPWQTWILWAVLIVGVMLLALMVWRLSRQMSKTANKE